MKTISSFFKDNGIPATGLSPIIRIWDITAGADTLVVTDAAMNEVGDGFYTYNFTTYDNLKDYVFRTDGTDTLNDNDRYQNGNNSNDVADVWEVDASQFVTPTSTGFKLNENNKFHKNRTIIDPVANTLTIYDDDMTTPIQVFNLIDENGAPSSFSVFERQPD